MPGHADERTPLLAAAVSEDRDADAEPSVLSDRGDSAEDDSSPQRVHGRPQAQQTKDAATQSKQKRRWPSLIAMIILGTLVVIVMVLGFVVPPAVQEYVENAAVLEPTDLSVESLTADGIRARVKGTFKLDGARVENDNARRIGRIVTGIMRQLGTAETQLQLHLPHYDNALVGSAMLPPITLGLVDGQVTDLDFVADFVPGDTETARKVVNEWLQGNLDQLKVTGATALRLKSGILPLGTHNVSESMVFQANELPVMPEYTVENLVFHDVPVGEDGQMGIGANVSITTYNDFPIGLTVPSLGFEVRVPNCDSSQPNIKVASAFSNAIDVHPKSNVTVEAQGTIRELPKSLVKACPSSKLSPLDHFMERYLQGDNAVVFVRGKAPETGDLPGWMSDILESVTVPLSLSGRSLDNFLRNFTLQDVDFKLPSPFADPSDPNGKPRVSGTVRILAAIPADLNIDIKVTNLRANGDLFYHGNKFGELSVDKWQKATSTIIRQSDDENLLSVTSRITNAPIDILDGDIFSDIMQELLFGDDDIVLDVESKVDVKVATVLGDLVIRRVPAAGKVPVKHVPRDTLAGLDPQVGELQILNTSSTGLHVRAVVNMTNTTPYAASIPFINIHLLKDTHLIGEAMTRNLHFVQGPNRNMVIEATWDPSSFGGHKAHQVARRLLSEYLSGKNTTLTLKAHRGSIPTLPVLGQALSRINITLSTPRLRLPGGGNDDGDDEDDDRNGRHGFIQDATFHLLSSTASFTLASPLGHDTVHVESIHATAFYNHTEPVGQITHNEPIAVPPGLSQTPRLPVQWSPSHVGLDKLRDALGGTLKLDAVAEVIVRVGSWTENVRYAGTGIGAKITL
ncbi:hypothetical protein E4U43_001230 [Claviceps pusilla]|uniref:Pre-rRNA processing protein n=1 Tax=Claviceps pusilla TaxID=123648 RepID=A0A9P7NAL0_9HYPO|nr:hypothetical protein E4U43_001230 [Claviceps pusilla]